MAVSVCKICGYRPRVNLWDEYLALSKVPNVTYLKNANPIVPKTKTSNFINNPVQPVKKSLLTSDMSIALANKILFFADDELNLIQ